MDRPDDPFVGHLGAFEEPMVLEELELDNQNPRPRDVGPPGHGGAPTYRRVRDASDRGKVSTVYSHIRQAANLNGCRVSLSPIKINR